MSEPQHPERGPEARSDGAAGPREPEPRPSSWVHLILGLRWPAALIALAVVLYLAYQQTCRTVEQQQQHAVAAVERAGEAAANIAARFRSGSITSTFIADIPRLVPDGGTRLELAAFESTETFTRSDELRVLFDMVSLGTTVTEIRVPVTYRYHLRLEDPWQLEVQGHACLVSAPRIRATLPPAIHTDRMEKRSERGWLRFNSSDQMEELERSVTPRLASRAQNPDHMGLVRDECRRKAAQFVRTWLLLEDHWRSDRFSSVSVVFADEQEALGGERPTLTLDDPERGTP